MNNVMVDLETLGTGNNAVLISIGAVKFDKNGLGETFYRRIDPQSCVDVGMEMSTSTVMWWMKQSDAARAEFEKQSESIKKVLTDFCTFMIGSDTIWGNGATFDNVLLSNAYKKCGMKQPWPYWGDRCYRTLKYMYPEIKLVREGTFHNALDDAISQAKHCILLLNEAKAW